jgi:catechol 2,3-dioxygenase-like lactoylglutathione lyase family enzyme
MSSSPSEVDVLKPHVALNVQSVPESVEFYRKMLGIEPSKVRDGYAKFDVATPALNLSLNQGPVTSHGALSHLGIQVASSDDVHRMRERWTGSGLEVRDEMQTNCCYAIQDKTWVRDPDGNEWEVFVVLEDNLESSSACCGTSGEDLVSLDL